MSRMVRKALLLGLACVSTWACEDVRLTGSLLQIDTFQQTPYPSVDILWVVDNSESMREERSKLGEKFDQFMSRLVESGANYHIGIVSTDTSNPTHSGRLQGNPRVITPDTVDAKAVFISNVDLPETANVNEQGLDAMRLALSDELLNGDNSGFIREGVESSLFVIVVSDEDDDSIGPIGYYARWLEHFKGPGNENLISLSAIVGDRPTGCVGAKEAGERYIQVQELCGGLFHSICELDYGPVVDELGIKASGLRRKFYLSEAPQENTIRVLLYAQDDPECQKTGDCPEGRVCTVRRRCAGELAKGDQGGVWIYEPGDNAVFFPSAYLPPAGHTFDVAYYRKPQ